MLVCAVALQLDVNGESTTLRRIEAKLRVPVIRKAAPVATVASFRHSVQDIQGACVGPRPGWQSVPLTAYNSCAACAGMASRVCVASIMTDVNSMVG